MVAIDMRKNQPQPNWQPISFLPKLAEMIDVGLEDAEETLQGFAEKHRLPVFDDHTVKRMFNAYTEQKELLGIYDTQLKIWQESQCQIKQEQATEISRLQGQMVKLKKVNGKLLSITAQLQGNTIETVMGKSDVELGLEVLLGKRTTEQ
ncbi:MAG: hypothetical protein HQK65_13455 [Desulfamplus sp.]|nr:hypothetical protein [Desulfamplus sp.]